MDVEACNPCDLYRALALPNNFRRGHYNVSIDTLLKVVPCLLTKLVVCLMMFCYQENFVGIGIARILTETSSQATAICSSSSLCTLALRGLHCT